MKAGKNYLVVVPWPLEAVGGVSVAVRGLISGLRASTAARPLLLVNSWKDRAPRFAVTAGEAATFLRIPDPMAQGNLLRSLFTLCVSWPICLWHLARMLRRESVDIVDFHYPGLHCVSVLALRWIGLYRGAIVVSFHGQDIYSVGAERGRFRKWLWQVVARRIDAVFVCSANLTDEVSSLLGVSRAIVSVAHNGIDAASAKRTASESKPPVELNRPYIVCLATYEHKKGLDVLLRAYAEFARNVPTVDLVIAGRAGPEFKAVEALVESLELCRRVTLLVDVPHDRALALLLRATQLVLPSRREPFGLVLLEAAVLGVPAICTTACGALDAIPAGFVDTVPSDDPETLCGAMLASVADLASARAKATALGRHVEHNLSWSAAAVARVTLAVSNTRKRRAK